LVFVLFKAISMQTRDDYGCASNRTIYDI
jgi:hypothetical protein